MLGVLNYINLFIFTMSSAFQIVEYVSSRSDRLNAWTQKTISGNKVVTRKLTANDFRNVKMSLMNMAQHRECYTNSQHRPSEDCWRLPTYDPRGNYIMDYDSEDYEEQVQLCK